MSSVFIVGILLLGLGVVGFALLKPPGRKKKTMEDRIHSSVRHQPADEQFSEPPSPSIRKKDLDQ